MASLRDFHHPYQPYDIQLEFMNALYECIEKRKVGIFESPTGTGKSLSLICGSLTWLRNHQLADVDKIDVDDDDEPDWVVEHAKSARRADFIERKRAIQTKLQKIREKEAQQRKRYETGEPLSKRIRINDNLVDKTDIDIESEFLLADYESDDESKGNPNASVDKDGISNKTLDFAIKLGLVSETKTEEEDIDEQVKIYFCSRTHSQLSQFTNEVRRVKIPFAETQNLSQADDGLAEEIKHLSLASRKNLCINKDVRRLHSTGAINERCLELQQSKAAKTRCSFLPNKENQTLVHQFRDYTIAKIRDIEDLGRLGEKLGICPYYASRATIKSSEVITLPYPLLLQKSAREALGICLKDHVVVIDEAHNLMDAIAGIYSEQIELSQLTKARNQLTAYLLKFRTRLKGKNRVYVSQTVRLIDSLILYLQGIVSSSKTTEGVVKISDALLGKGADQINLYKLTHYLQESKLARKVDNYTVFSEENHKKQEGSTPALTQCQSFFQTLTYPLKDGRFFYSKDDGDIQLKYLLLDPTEHFREVVEEARAVILAGGTMSPMEDYKQHLFSYIDPDRLMTLSCGHVIPSENLVAMPLSKARSGAELDFTYDKRNDPKVITGLGQTIIGLASVIPDGLVVFFPSYAYLEQVINFWKRQQDNRPSIFEQLENHKTIIYEDKSQNAAVDDTLDRYSSLIHSSNNTRGAILLSVVGGKLSEGINFSDALGRGVMVVGLPFPNIQSAEWKAKLEYVEQQALGRGEPTAQAKMASRTFYENACMRAVNQCIGRAIRHRDDYAGIFLLDRRYATPRIQKKLPGWIQKGLINEAAGWESGEVEQRVKLFFAGKH